MAEKRKFEYTAPGADPTGSYGAARQMMDTGLPFEIMVLDEVVLDTFENPAPTEEDGSDAWMTQLTVTARG